MKSQCPISSIEFPTPEFQWIKTNPSLHPIFQLSTRQLLTQAGRWSSGSLSESESRLLFLALLRSTQLIEFKSPAQPSSTTISKNMELVILFANWADTSLYIRHPSAKSKAEQTGFPGYIVSYPATHTMDNIRTYLDAWINISRDLDFQYRNRILATPETRARDEALRRLIRGGKKKLSPKHLAIWALDVCGYNQGDLYDYHLRLFQLREPEIYKSAIAPNGCYKIIDGYGTKPLSPLTQDLIELVSIMEEGLERYSRQGESLSRAVLEHVRKLRDINLEGPARFYGLEDMHIVQSSKDLIELKAAYDRAPKEKPVKSSYKSIADFVTDLSLYNRGKDYLKIMEERSNSLKAEFQASELEADKEAEDSEIEMEELGTLIQIIENEEY